MLHCATTTGTYQNTMMNTKYSEVEIYPTTYVFQTQNLYDKACTYCTIHHWSLVINPVRIPEIFGSISHWIIFTAVS